MRRDARIASLRLALLLALPQSVWAACGVALPDILRNAYPGIVQTAQGYALPEDRILREEIACAAWPAHPGWTLLAVRFRQPSADPDVIPADLDVLVVDTASRKLLYRLYERGGAESVMADMDGIGIDVTPYPLDASTTAFGVLLSRKRDSAKQPYRLRTLKWYVVEGGALRRVLSDFNVEMQRGEQKDACTGWFETHAVTLSPGSGSHGGMQDWNVRTEVKRRTRARVEGKCDTREEAPQVTTGTLTYRGRQYHQD